MGDYLRYGIKDTEIREYFAELEEFGGFPAVDEVALRLLWLPGHRAVARLLVGQWHQNKKQKISRR